MNIFNRRTSLKRVLWYAVHSGVYGFRLMRFDKPMVLLNAYLKQTPLDTKLVHTRNGIRIHLSHHRHDAITLFLIFIRRDYGSINRYPVVVDIGANIGTFSLFAAYSGAGIVYSFEPNGEAYDVLLRNIQDNNLSERIIPHKLAVSYRQGEVSINPTSSPYNKIVHGDEGKGGERVSTVSLDQVIDSNGINSVDLLKMDCEGEEYAILEHVSDGNLKKIRRIRMEYHKGADTLVGRLQAKGFKLIKHTKDSADIGILWFEQTYAEKGPLDE